MLVADKSGMKLPGRIETILVCGCGAALEIIWDILVKHSRIKKW